MRTIFSVIFTIIAFGAMTAFPQSGGDSRSQSWIPSIHHTMARASTVIEPSCYFGWNKAVEYRDIELYALRDSQYPGGVKLGMLIQLRLLKGRRNRGYSSVSLTKMH